MNARGWELALAIGLMLVAMTIVTGLAGRRVKSEPGLDLLDSFSARIKSWWLIAAFVLVAKYGGPLLSLILLFLLSFYALREFYSLTPTSRSDHFTLASAFYLVLPLQYVLIGGGWTGAFQVFIPTVAYLFLPLVSLMRRDTRDFLARISTVQWGLMAAVYCVSHLAALMLLPLPGLDGRGHYLVIHLLLMVQIGETARDFLDRTVGRIELAASIEPGRTLEGFAGQVLAGVFVGVLLLRYLPFSIGEGLVLAVATSLAGALGNWVMAAIKRDRGVRDWGGVMDRLQGVCFAAPVYYLLVR